MASLGRFSTLPTELRRMIWEFAVPAQVVEVGEPCDPDIIPEKDLRKAWRLNCKCPTLAHVCHESREIALARAKLPKNFMPPELSLTDPRWWWGSTDIIHLNAHEADIRGAERWTMQDELLDLINIPINNPTLRKQVSISADIVHPFLRFREVPNISSSLVWDVLSSLGRCIIALHTVCIRATEEQARKLGLFGNGEELAQLIDPFDKALIKRFRELWNNTEQEMSAIKFFDTIDTNRFEFRVQRWLAEMAIEYIKYKWSDFPPPGLFDVIATLRQNQKHRDSTEVQQYLVGYPTLDLRILFRLCPPA